AARSDVRQECRLVRTYQTRLQVDPVVVSALDAYGELFGRALRTLHARRRAGSATPKPQFMVEFGLTARQFNAVRVSLDGIERSYRERLPKLIAEDRARLCSTRRRLEKTDDRFKRHHLARHIARIGARITSREGELATGAVRIC